MTQATSVRLEGQSPIPVPSILTQLKAMQTFLFVWLGQVVSLTGSSMTGFALGVWVYQQTGSATYFALILLFNMLPKAIVAPAAGIVADRWDRRWIMIGADLGAGMTTVLTALLFASGQLAIWHIYLFTALNASFSALQGPAAGASVTQLVPKSQFGRASGLMQLGQGIGQIAAPVLAGVLITIVGLQGVLLIDMATFLFAVSIMLLVRFPRMENRDDVPPAKPSWVSELGEAWRYLVDRPGLMGLIVIFALVNFFVGIAEAVLTPMILNFATADTLGLIMSIGGLGMLIGSVVMSVWGGGRRKIYAAFGAYALLGVGVLLAGVAPSIPLVATAIFLAFLCLPTVMSASQAILQVKVAPNIQGRVFALRMMLNTISFAIAFLIGGLLADQVFEPLLATNGYLAGNVGLLIGTGPGRGMGLMFIVMGVLSVLTAISAFMYPRVRRVEIELPDAVSD
jgi:DHA3 family macrolide efflux protein-like MFS transporter